MNAEQVEITTDQLVQITVTHSYRTRPRVIILESPLFIVLLALCLTHLCVPVLSLAHVQVTVRLALGRHVMPAFRHGRFILMYIIQLPSRLYFNTFILEEHRFMSATKVSIFDAPTG